MQHILHNYQLRLTNISQGNRALKLGKLSARRDLDWTDLGFLEEESPEILFQKVMAGKNVRLINKLDARFEPTNVVDKRLNQIFRTVESMFEETGTQDLYVGYPFVEGKFADGTIVRCPVLLFPVNLVRNLQSRPRWQLQVSEDAEIQFNPTFFLAYQQYQKSRIAPTFWEETLEYQENWQDFLLKLYEHLKKYEIEVNFNSDLYAQKLERFTDYLKETMEAFPLGKLIFRSQAVLGIFPQSDSALMQDYEVIKENELAFSVSSIFNPENKVETSSNVTHIPEEKRFFVSEIDASQEEVLLKVKSGKSLVVHGPPGTGKSQVIVNMIADALMEGKKVLVVSQKRAALDVVFKRLSAFGLGRFAALVHDTQTDRSAIFHKIKQQIDDISLFQADIASFDRIKSNQEYDILSRQADNSHSLYENLYQALLKVRDCGLSVHELYQKCDIASPKYAIEKISSRVDVYSLRRMLDKYAQIWEYADFLSPDYPWHDRISFHLYQYEDKQQILAKIQKIPTQIAELHDLYATISPLLGKDILDSTVNAKRIENYQKADSIIQNEILKQGIAAIYKDELKADFIQKTFAEMEKAFHALEKCSIIEVLSWSSCLELLEKINIYIDNKNKVGRFLNIQYLKSVSFIKQVFKGKNIVWEDPNFDALVQETEYFRKVWALWTQTHHLAFFEDFPLDKFFKNADEWLEMKQKQFDAWAFIDSMKDFRSYRPSFSYGTFEVEKWNETKKVLRQFEGFQSILGEISSEWESYLHSNQIITLKKEIAIGNSSFAQQLQESLIADFEELKILDTYFADFSDEERETWEVIENEKLKIENEGKIENEKLKIENEKSNNSQFLTFNSQLTNSFYFYWIQQAEQESPVLLEVSGRGWQRKQQDLATLLSEKRAKVPRFIVNSLKERICGSLEYNRLQNTVTFRDIAHQVSKKRRLWTMRKLVQETWDKGLNTLIPCWMASPESVSAMFPMQKDYFDLVIFDEASQCFVEKAIPVMLRGKQSIIAGDSKQLQPFDMYSVKYEEAEFSDSDIALEAESALDLAKSNFEEAKLLWHYRSKEEELINFSNQAFYEGKLQVIPHASAETGYFPPLEWLAVAGKWETNRNVVEAERVIELILELIQRADSPSLGIVTFNYFQQELIKDLIDKKSEELAISNPSLYEKLQNTLQKTENEEYVGLFVKNIENVQGDERDIIIFSVGYAQNDKGKLVTNFGLLNLQGGENRLNVAITRAKHKIYVICSFNPAELAVENAKYDGPKLLKNYLQYVKAISEGKKEMAHQILQYQNASSPTLSVPNAMADYIEVKLREKGFFILRNFGDTRYKIDIAVKQNAEAKDFLLAIECEGSHYFSSQSAKERGPILLQQRGWKSYRVWARNFWLNKEKEVEKILAILG